MIEHRSSLSAERRRLGVWLVAGCCAIWWLRVALAEGTRLSLANIDALIYWVPLMREAAAQWRRWSVPLWNPYQALGTPLLATLHVGAGYPLNALYLVCDVRWAWFLTCIAHQAVAAGGIYRLCRLVNLSARSSAIGVAAYTFAVGVIGSYLDQPQFNSLAWVPVVFACATRLIVQPTAAAGARLASAWALQILAGHPETIAYTALLLASYLIVAGIARAGDAPQTLARIAALAIGAAGMALGAAAFQLWPTIELLGRSVRAVGSLTAAQRSPLAVDPWQILSVAQGPAPLVLAVIGWWSWRRRSLAWLLAGSAAVLAVLSVGPATPLFTLFTRLPIGSWFRGPIRLLILWPLCVAVLGAAGAETCLESRDRAGARTAVIGGLVVIGVRVLLGIHNGTPRTWLPGVVLELAVLLVVIGAAATPQRSISCWIDSAWALVLVYAAPIALFMTAPGPGYVSPFDVVPRYEEHRQLFDVLVRELPARTLSLLPGKGAWAKLGTYFEMPMLNDVEPMSLSEFRRFVGAARGVGAEAESDGPVSVFMGGIDPPRARFNSALLNASGVRFVLAERKATGEVGVARWFESDIPLRPIASFGTVVAYDNPAALPRAFFVDRARARAPGSNCVRDLVAPAFDPRSTLLIEDTRIDAGSVPSRQARVTVTHYEPAEVRVDVETDQPGFVVLSDAFYPGWLASVDRIAASIARANCFFRAVAVPAGQHEVVFEYRPMSFAYGAVISAVSLLALLAVWIVSRATSARKVRSP